METASRDVLYANDSSMALFTHNIPQNSSLPIRTSRDLLANFGPSMRRALLSMTRRQASITCLASTSVANQCASKHSARNVPLNDSTYALSVGFPGREKSICTPFWYAQRSITWLIWKRQLPTAMAPQEFGEKVLVNRRCLASERHNFDGDIDNQGFLLNTLRPPIARPTR